MKAGSAMTNVNKSIDQIASDMVAATLSYARSELIAEAHRKLDSTSIEYKSAISAIKMDGPMKGHISLNGAFPAMLEEGASQFNMKVGFYNSPKKKKVTRLVRGKSDPGWFLTIPYRHKTSGKGALPSAIMKAAKGLDYGEYLSESLVRELGFKPQTSFTGYKWRNAKYDHLQRAVKTYKSGHKRGQYTTFRRVSDKSDPKSWIHPGLKGIKAFPTVSRKAEKFAYDYLEANL